MGKARKAIEKGFGARPVLLDAERPQAGEALGGRADAPHLRVAGFVGLLDVNLLIALAWPMCR